MNRISILDCTLRDGGYVNDFRFGKTVIENIIYKLANASIEIVECGFLRSQAYDEDKSLFGSVESIKEVIHKKNPNTMYVAMIQYGGITNEEISSNNGDSVDGIRLTFHEHEIEEAFVLGQQLMDKGYKVFMQPVGTMTYTDSALLALIERVNQLKPYAFYMVDTLGTMYKNDLLRMYYLIDHNLDKRITLGFHSHNNLQLSFANAQELIQLNTARKLIIDSSIYGMGRGAGNLNTELVTQYINANFGLQYDNILILELLDEYIKPLSVKYKWGYDAAYYIASVVGCHPNYASFLLNKQTLHVQDIYAILNSLSIESRALFDKDYIGEIYLSYMNHKVDDFQEIVQLKQSIGKRKVLILAPGSSLKTSMFEITERINGDDYYVISINFIPQSFKCDMVFVSNMKRFSNIKELLKQVSENTEVVVTSNVNVDMKERIRIVDFASYINEEQCILDNAGLMCLNMLKKIGVDDVRLAGFDGFSNDSSSNFYEQDMALDVNAERLLNVNRATKEKIKQLGKQMSIEFWTKSKYASGEKNEKI